jgi:hypothetical protein
MWKPTLRQLELITDMAHGAAASNQRAGPHAQKVDRRGPPALPSDGRGRI